MAILKMVGGFEKTKCGTYLAIPKSYVFPESLLDILNLYCFINAILPAQLVFRKDQENQRASGVSESWRSFGTRSNVGLWFWTFWVMAMWNVGFLGPRPMLRK